MRGKRTLEGRLFRFRYPLSGKWVRARYRMQVPELQRCYGEWKITGALEIRHVTAAMPEQFSPFRAQVPVRIIIAPMLLWAR
jgi:hypothetical protein